MDKQNLMANIDLKDLKDPKDNEAKVDKIHNIKASNPTYKEFYRLNNELTLNLDKTKSENEIFLRKMLYLVENNMDEFASSYKEVHEIEIEK